VIGECEHGLTRRDFLRLAGVASAGLVGLDAFRRIAGGTEPPVRTGYLPITDASALLVAHARGLYGEEGLSAEPPRLFRSWAAIAEAFMARHVNVVHLLMPTAIWMRYARKFPARLVAWGHTNGSALTARHDVTNIRQLGGSTVAIPFWYSVHNVTLQLLLRSQGLKVVTRRTSGLAPDEVNLTVMAPPDMPPALANRAIAGYIVAEPFNAAAEAMGIGRILRFTGDAWLDHACCVVVMHEDDIANRPAWAQGVINAIVRAQWWMRAHREEAARLISRDGQAYLPQPYAVVSRVFSFYDARFYGPRKAIVHPEWNTQRINFQPYPFPSYTERLVWLLKETWVEGDREFLDALDPAAVHLDLVEERFVRTAVAKVGGPEAFGIPQTFRRTELVVP
jgi:NitT/TauT family transport system substrate-binding protein